MKDAPFADADGRRRYCQFICPALLKVFGRHDLPTLAGLSQVLCALRECDSHPEQRFRSVQPFKPRSLLHGQLSSR